MAILVVMILLCDLLEFLKSVYVQYDNMTLDYTAHLLSTKLSSGNLPIYYDYNTCNMTSFRPVLSYNRGN